ncbi:MAG: hypothetical protein V1702_04260 [Candidatus Woesearchaeota archaeon]
MKGKLIALVTAAVALYSLLQLKALPEIKRCALSQNLHLAGCISAWVIILCLALAAVLVSCLILLLKKPEAIEALFRKKRLPIALLAAIIATISVFYFAPGDVALGDAAAFTATARYAHDAIRHLQVPFWNFYWNAGVSIFSAYGFLAPLAAGLLGFITGDINTAVKLYMFIAQVAGSIFAFLFIEKISNSKKAAFIGALAYSLSLEHIGRIMIGRTQAAMLYALAPLLFLVFEKYIGKKQVIPAIALVCSLLFFTHPADGAFIIAIFAVYALIRSRKIMPLAAAGAIFLLIVSVWAAPFFMEKNTITASEKASGNLALKMPDGQALIGALTWHLLPGYREIFYLGIITILLAATGAIYAFRKKLEPGKAMAISLAVALLLTFVQSPRYLPVLVLMLSALAGISMLALPKPRAFIIIAVIIMIDFFPSFYQATYIDDSYQEALHREIALDKSDFRVLDLHSNRRTYWPSKLYTDAGLQTVFSPVIESSPPSIPYLAAISQKAAHEIYDLQQPMSEATIHGLEMFNVKYVIIHNSQIGRNAEETFSDKSPSLGLERNLSIITLNSTQVIAAESVECCYATELDSEQPWLMRIKFEQRAINSDITDALISRVHESIPLKEGSNESTGSNASATARVISAKTELSRVALEVETTPAYLMLAYSYYPWLEVMVDGKDVPFMRTAFNTIAIKVEGGRHEIEIIAHPSPLRKVLFYFSAAAFIACLLLFLYRHKPVFEK